MSSAWDLAVPQAMQRHGGSHRSVPKPAVSAPVKELSRPNASEQVQQPDKLEVAVTPKSPAA